ncbi:MAG: hypothetical protein P4L71_04880 [Acetobacteraceae bacterium]|nr:hypothetical protein [Acetobacteraceae bacterium]
MTFPPVSPEVMQTAQIVTGATMAGWLLAGFFPRYSYRARAAVLALYLIAAVGFVLYVTVG